MQVSLQLSLIEVQRLEVLESVIEAGMQTFVHVGNALLEIRDSRLYRTSHGTFEDYCREKWRFTRMRASQLIAAAEVVGNVNHGLQLPATERQARPLATLPPDAQREVWATAVETAPGGKVTAAHVQATVNTYRSAVNVEDQWGHVETYSSVASLPLTASNHAVSFDPDYDGDEWYTPAEVIALARKVLGDIDLDPASCPEAQRVVLAGDYYDKESNGLLQPWHGRVWLNPPYSAPLIQHFIDKTIQEWRDGNIAEAIVLVNNSTETRWFQSMLSNFTACFISRRLQFWRADSQTFGARQGQCAFYLGNNKQAFVSAFQAIGTVARRTWIGDQ